MGMFISQKGMAESKRTEAIANSVRKRHKLENHPIRQSLCSCSPDCGTFHIIDISVDMSTIRLAEKHIGDKGSEYDECHHFK